MSDGKRRQQSKSVYRDVSGRAADLGAFRNFESGCDLGLVSAGSGIRTPLGRFVPVLVITATTVVWRAVPGSVDRELAGPES
jgi:hypothetical protein